MSHSAPWVIQQSPSPFVAAAIHDGHHIRSDLRPYIALSNDARLREEDPQTGFWAAIAPTSIVGRRSRFEVDLNRPRERCVYIHPADAWGLRVWNEPLPEHIIEESYALYDSFYAEVERLYETLLSQHSHLVVFDLHTYNHRRKGPYASFEDELENPEVNLGTGTLDRSRWSGLIDRFKQDLSDYSYLSRRLDVRENVKFLGGQFASWSHQKFEDRICVLSIEFKKFFMDEWTGEVDVAQSEAIRQALESTVNGVCEELSRL